MVANGLKVKIAVSKQLQRALHDPSCGITFTLTFNHLADTFIQSDLQMRIRVLTSETIGYLDFFFYIKFV